MENYKTYVDKLEKSMPEKLFFLDKLDVDFDSCIFIDFGCANGTLCQILAENYPKAKVFGIEKDNFLRQLACEKNTKNKNVEILKSLDEVDNKNTKGIKIIICSSVLHECNLDIQHKVLNFAKKYCDYLVIRDMRYELLEDVVDIDKLWSVVAKKTNTNMLKQFKVNCENCIANTYKDLVHYLLKYEYLDNWKTEVKENYFSVEWAIFDNNLSPTYIRDYLLEYKRKKIKEDFDIDLKCFTHRQAIYQIKPYDENISYERTFEISDLKGNKRKKKRWKKK